ncbi:hypothetical protein D9M68_699820 [compost metagenome]
MAVLHQADVLLAGADGHLHAIGDDLFGGGGDGHQAGGALAVESLAADGGRQAGGQRAHAAEVPAGGASRHRGAHHQVFDFPGADTGALHGGANGEGGHARCCGGVERATERLGDGRAGGGKDDGFFHGHVLPGGCWRRIRPRWLAEW